VVVAFGLTLTEVPVTGPTPGAILRLAAPLTDQLRAEDWRMEICGGLAAKPAMTGGPPTVTVVVAVREPDGLPAVRVYVVVAAGVTFTEAPVTEPTPGAILTLVAPVTDQ
jgi:hypothetical protein